MKIISACLLAFCFWLVPAHAQPLTPAATGLIIHAVEFGVGKFHRFDHQLHPYAESHAWKNYVLPAEATEVERLIRKNADGSYTVFFTHLEEALTGAVEISKQEHQPVAILNLEAHGMPGAMWFPKNARQRDSFICKAWRRMAEGSDEADYEKYYSPTNRFEFFLFRQLARLPARFPLPCVTSAPQWIQTLNEVPEFRQVLAPHAEVHIVACLVGAGKRGKLFTHRVAQALFPESPGKLMTLISLGMGDWSMEGGLGFWNYFTRAQLSRDNELYAQNKRDADIVTTGRIRIAESAGGSVRAQVYELNLLDVRQPLDHNPMSLLQDSAAPGTR